MVRWWWSMWQTASADLTLKGSVLASTAKAPRLGLTPLLLPSVVLLHPVVAAPWPPLAARDSSQACCPAPSRSVAVSARSRATSAWAFRSAALVSRDEAEEEEEDEAAMRAQVKRLMGRIEMLSAQVTKLEHARGGGSGSGSGQADSR